MACLLAVPLAAVQDNHGDIDDRPIDGKHDEIGVLAHGWIPYSRLVISARMPLTRRNPLRDNIPIANQNVTGLSVM